MAEIRITGQRCGFVKVYAWPFTTLFLRFGTHIREVIPQELVRLNIFGYFHLKSLYVQKHLYHRFALFGGGGMLAIVIALLTVSYQSVKTAMMDPVEWLRNN